MGHWEGKAEVEAEVNRLLASHNVTGWSIRWDRAKRRAGGCNYREKYLTFSTALLPLYSRQMRQQVILHEVAHVLAGSRAKHGPKWKRIALELGAHPKALLPSSLPSPPAPWVGMCPRCGARRELFSQPRRVISCGSCAPTFTPHLIYRWEHKGAPTEPGGAYARELSLYRTRR